MKLIYGKALRRALLSTFIVLFSLASFSATYYVSSAGSDANSGLSTSLPWKTLGKVNATIFIPGDQILFKKGDTFYGSLTIGQSGTSGSRIVYGAYGTGANPNITGFTSVTSWTNLGGNIWESANAVSGLSDLNMVVINGVNTGMGRTPNTGYYYYQAHTSGTISSNNLTGFNWTGAECAYNDVPYTIKRLKITGASGTALWLNGTTGSIWDNQQFIIQDDIRCCDVQNEWYYNPSTKKLKIYSTLQPSNVQVSTVDQLIGVSASNITLENLTITGSNARSINIGGSSITIQNCNIAYSGTDAIDGTWNATGSNILIINCTITESNHGGIAFTRFFSNVTISSNTITNSAMIYGASAKASMSNNATINYGISAHCTHTLIELNHVENSGYIGISTFGMVDQIIQKNFVKTFCVHSHDGGGIYTWNGTVPSAINTGMKILNNIVIGNSADGTAGDADSDAGIYLDDYSNSVEVADNIVTGNQYGIFLHDNHDIVVQRNTTFDNDKGLRIYGEVGIPMNNITSNNNIFVAKTGGQWAMHLDPIEAILPTFAASNNIYARPIIDTYTIGGYYRTPFSSIAKSVPQWQTYSGKDANSLKSSQVITNENDLTIEYNSTKSIKTVTLSQPMIDVKGAKYAGSLTLQPYTSVVLMKDLSSAVVPGASTSVVATAGNSSASVTFVAPVSNGGSAITGYTVTSSPVGGVDANAGTTSLTRTITGLINGTAYTFMVKATNSVGTSVASAPSNSVTPQALLTATTFAFTGPSSGNVNSASSNFTVTPNISYTGTITITPSGSGSNGLAAIILNFSNSSTAQTFTITPNVAGTIILTPSNGGSLNNPASLTYTSQAVVPDVPVVPNASDIISPVVSTFSIPATSTSLVVPISSLSATDNVGVTGYLLTETSSTPSSGTAGWTSTKPTEYTFAAIGSKTLYVWVKDAVGNVSTSLSSGLNITLSDLSPEYSTYSFEELSGTTVIDSSSSYDGNIINTASRVSGIRGNGLSLTGTGYVNLGQVYGDVQDGLTLSAWVKPTPGGDYVGVIMHGGPHTDTFSLYLNHTLGTIAFKTEGATSGKWTEIANSTIWDGSWHLLSATYDGSLKIIYLDAVPIITVYATGMIDSGSGYNLLIGAGRDEIPVPTSILYQGIIDEVRIYNFALNSSQIYSLYNLPTTPDISTPLTSVYSTEYKSICEGSNYKGWTTTEKYERTLISRLGGDSIVTTYLTVNPKYTVTENVNITKGESYNGWTTTGTYSRTLPTITSCDSIVTTNLTVDALNPTEGENLTNHFVPVWQGENGQNHMNLIVVSAISEDLPLSVDDEIAVFSGSSCVGTKKLSQTINLSDNSTFLTIQASQDDGQGNGFIISDTIIFKIWDHQNQKEMLAKAVTYLDELPTWLTSGKYAPGATSLVKLISYEEFTQSIPLIKGNNLFSTYLVPTKPNVSIVMKSLCDQGALSKMQDETGNSFEFQGNYGGWINNIGSIEKTEGYNIRVLKNCTLQVAGRLLVKPLEIPLTTGWNIISFPRAEMVDAMTVIQSLIDQNKLVKVQDEKGNSIEHLKQYGGWVNNIGNFIPGKAYKVKVNASANLIITQNYSKSANILAKSVNTEYFSTVIEGNGSNHMNINLVGLNNSDLSIGDELAAFDGELCVGALKLTADHLIRGTASLVASNSTNDNIQNGFIEGHLIQIQSWNQLTGDVSTIQTEIVEGQLTYEKSASVLVQLKSATTSIGNLSDLVKIDVFPNPSQGRVTVRFSHLPETGSKIEILDISGRMITSRLITGIAEEFNLEFEPAGLYVVKSILGSVQTTHKLIIK